MKEFKLTPDHALLDRSTYVSDVDQKFSLLKKDFGDRVQDCSNNISEEDIIERISYFRHRAPKEVVATILKLSENELRHFVIKDIVIDRIVLPSDEQEFKDNQRIFIEKKSEVEINNAETELLNKLFGQQK